MSKVYQLYAVLLNSDELPLSQKYADVEGIKKEYERIMNVIANNTCRAFTITDGGYIIPTASILYIYIKEEGDGASLFFKPTHKEALNE
jgi:hypothetical protein